MDNVYDIKREKNLNYILPLKTKLEKQSEDKYKGKAVVVVHLHYLDTLAMYLSFIASIPDGIDIVFTFSDDTVKAFLQQTAAGRRENCKFIKKKNRGRDVSALLVACREEILRYEYVCFLHDKKEKKSVLREDTQAWVRSLWENMLGGTAYIENILATFDANPGLGLLAPPFPITRHFSSFYMYAWGQNFDITKKLAQKMELNCNLDITKPPITLGTVFWARTAALKKLFAIEWKYESFDEEPLKADGTVSHGIERILAYVAQDAGFESGWVMTDQYAGLHLERMQDALKTAFHKLNDSLGISWLSEIEGYESRVRDVLDFVKSYERFYIYGAGNWGMRYFAMLKTENIAPTAFLVSDRRKNPKDIQGIPVYSVAEVALDEQCGIIIGVTETLQEEVVRAIHDRNPEFNNIYVQRR